MAAKNPIYLDNASTSYPKPPSVMRAMERAITRIGASPGRGGYSRAREADRLVFETRKLFSDFFGLSDPSRLIFTPGCTYSLNIAIRGLLKRGDHVIMTGREHNAALRPVRERAAGIRSSSLHWDGKSRISAGMLAKLATPKTRAVLINHASNVDGLLFPLAGICAAARKLGLSTIVDAAQTAGMVNIDMEKIGVDILCAAGHKGLMGPTGIGILAVSRGVDIKPLIAGGTGSFSDDMDMPESYPDRFEPGSQNLPAIAGLNAALKEILKRGVQNIFGKKMELCEAACRGISGIRGLKVYWPEKKSIRAPLFSFTIRGMDPSETGDILDGKYGIACRVGMHCAPEAHREMGTYPEGTLRFAPGIYTTRGEISSFIKAVREIAAKR